MTRDARLAQRAVDLALVAIKRGELAEAASNLTTALNADPQNADAFYHLARVYSLAGQDAASAQVFRLALETLPDVFLSARTFVHYQGRSFDAKTTLNFFTALAETTSIIRGYLAPSPIVGTYGPEQTPEQDAAIRRHLDDCWSAWKADTISLPLHANIFLDRSVAKDIAFPRTFVFLPKYVSSNPDFVTSVFATHLNTSLADLGVTRAFHPADDLCFDTTNPDAERSGRKSKAKALEELDQHLARFRPDVVVMDGAFEEAEVTIGLNDLLWLKSRHRFRLAVLIPDSYPPLPNYAIGWQQAADLTVGFTDPELLLALTHGETFNPPIHAIGDSLIKKVDPSKKDIDLSYTGSRTRNRDFWCAHAVVAGIDATISITNRRADLAFSDEKFFEILGQSRLVFSNGFVTPELDILSLRLFEASASGAIVIQHGVAAQTCFIPYIHYVPVTNVHEFICFARFLLAHEDYRRRMSNEAQSFFHSHYRGELFWRAMFARIG
jgi:tetratricopeptide (TPR) repeat protein